MDAQKSLQQSQLINQVPPGEINMVYRNRTSPEILFRLIILRLFCLTVPLGICKCYTSRLASTILRQSRSTRLVTRETW
ncbi:hypothetical protein ASPFODRAFT_47928 [Aspergillus luchuensis CBS 106.47]|uniref:Uncharacterized protein n=1 Tax=Aspergillus luchuensis (strain CBS 106.47) TaxID=1137211 RepID=A0A1M3TF46_ASPLC|nr:hypothetical protein ASPFODRAFT_47928 [Aspergillus luchuensis CBS 106.47]